MANHTPRILVTGSAGWLGHRVVEAIGSGSLGDAEPESKPRLLIQPGQDAAKLRAALPYAEIVTGDLRAPADCERFCAGAGGGLLLHTAGVIHPRRAREFDEVNGGGMEKLLNAAIKAGIKRIVAVSSNSPCGCNPHPDHLFDEYSPFRPYLGYGWSKMRMEQAVMARKEEIETVILRAPWFYGPNQPARQTLFFKMVRDGKAPLVGNGSNLRSMTYLDNLCQAIALAVKKTDAGGRVYWIADKEPYQMRQILDTIELLLEKEFGQKCAHKRMRLPGIASSLAYAVDAMLQGLGFYSQKIHVLSEMNKTIACSISRAERELGYRPQVSLEEGMRRSIRWCIDNGQLQSER